MKDYEKEDNVNPDEVIVKKIADAKKKQLVEKKAENMAKARRNAKKAKELADAKKRLMEIGAVCDEQDLEHGRSHINRNLEKEIVDLVQARTIKREANSLFDAIFYLLSFIDHKKLLTDATELMEALSSDTNKKDYGTTVRLLVHKFIGEHLEGKE